MYFLQKEFERICYLNKWNYSKYPKAWEYPEGYCDDFVAGAWWGFKEAMLTAPSKHCFVNALSFIPLRYVARLTKCKTFNAAMYSAPMFKLHKRDKNNTATHFSETRAGVIFLRRNKHGGWCTLKSNRKGLCWDQLNLLILTSQPKKLEVSNYLSDEFLDLLDKPDLKFFIGRGC